MTFFTSTDTWVYNSNDGTLKAYEPPHLTKDHRIAKAIYEKNALEYHNWNHVVRMIGLIPEEVKQAKIVNLQLLVDAIVWHDAVYVPGASDNEEKSAELFEILNPPHQGKEWVKSLIMATKSHNLDLEVSPALRMENTTLQHELIIDLDLYGLSDPWYDYIRTGAKIREEFKTYGNEEFMQGRIKFLETFLSRKSIYRTGFFNDRESTARYNLERELYVIERLGRLPYES